MTEQERAKHIRCAQINKYKSELRKLDIKTMKFIDGDITEEEYAPYREKKAELREKIREREKKIKESKGT